MSNKKADISQIRKYLDGELDARAMHQLEREAQDDPFLMEAMEGFEQTGTDQHANLADLEARLQVRTARKKVRPLWPYISVAASLLIVFTIGYWLWPHSVQESIQKEKQMATVIDHPQEKTDTVPPAAKMKADENAMASTPVPPKVNNEVIAKPSAQPTVTADEVSTAPPATDQALAKNEKTAEEQSYASKSRSAQTFGYTTAAAPADSVDKLNTDQLARLKKSDSGTPQLKEIRINGKSAPQQAAPNAAIATVLQGKVEGVSVTTPEHRVIGTIYDELGAPLPGVSVSIANSRIATLTDVNGRFALAAKNGQLLDIKYIGYNQKTVAAKDSLRVALSANQQSLSEVVVVGYGTVKPEVDNSAHPKAGWDNYNRYLKNMAVAADGQTGVVRLEFTVAADGSLDNFKVLKSLNKTADQMAIDMVKNGPAWQPATDGKTKTIKLRIRFIKK